MKILAALCSNRFDNKRFDVSIFFSNHIHVADGISYQVSQFQANIYYINYLHIHYFELHPILPASF